MADKKQNTKSTPKTEKEWSDLSGYNLQKSQEKVQTGAQRNIGPEMGVDKVFPPDMQAGANRRKAEKIPSDIADQLQTDRNERAYKNWEKSQGMKKGGKVGCKCMAKGGSASSRADGCAQRGKTRGKIV